MVESPLSYGEIPLNHLDNRHDHHYNIPLTLWNDNICWLYIPWNPTFGSWFFFLNDLSPYVTVHWLPLKLQFSWSYTLKSFWNPMKSSFFLGEDKSHQITIKTTIELPWNPPFFLVNSTIPMKITGKSHGKSPPNVPPNVPPRAATCTRCSTAVARRVSARTSRPSARTWSACAGRSSVRSAGMEGAGGGWRLSYVKQ